MSKNESNNNNNNNNEIGVNLSEVINKVHCADCIEFIESMPDESVHLIITSPPYYVGKNYNEGANYETKNVIPEWHKFVDWLVDVFLKCERILISGGKLVINIDDRHVGLKTVGRNLTLPTHAELIHRLSSLTADTTLDYKEKILWKKIRNAHATGGSRRMLGSYGSHRSPGEIPIVQEVEYCLFFRKQGTRKIDTETRKASALTPDEFKKYGMQIWEVQPERDRSHPAPFPLEIPHRFIKLFTFVGDIVFDPFGGSATTALAARNAGRNFIVVDLEQEYVDMANARLGGKVGNLLC